MNLRQLKYFVRVADLGGISLAAVDLRIAQPALSRQIRTLEESLGAQLFIRNGRGVSLTDTGEEFYNKVREILTAINNACVEARESQDVPSGNISLGVLPNMGPSFISDILTVCNAKFPDVKIEIFEGFSYQIASWIQGHQIDLGFVYNIKDFSNLVSEFQIIEDGYLVGGPQDWGFGDIVSFEKLTEFPLITPAIPSFTKEKLQKISNRKGIELKYKYQVDSLEAIKCLVQRGEGYAVLTFAAVWEEVNAGKLMAARICDPEITYELSLASPFGTILPQATNVVIEELKAVVERNTLRRPIGPQSEPVPL